MSLLFISFLLCSSLCLLLHQHMYYLDFVFGLFFFVLFFIAELEFIKEIETRKQMEKKKRVNTT